MKKTILLFACSSLLLACGGADKKEKDVQPHEQAVEGTGNVKEVLALENDPRNIGPEKGAEQSFIEEIQVKLSSEQEKEIFGYWVGDFGKTNVINITLYDVRDDSVFGYSVCAGNFRELKGKIMNSDNGMIAFNMKEPGDDTYDGEFNFDINTEEMSLNGSWKPYKEGVTDAKQYDLRKRTYSYDKTVGPYPEASQRKLKDEELANLMGAELEEMRNAIYARHGYSFKNKNMRLHFNKMDWYMPMGIDIREQITDIEAYNIEKIYRYESYFEEYYDDYGR